MSHTEGDWKIVDESCDGGSVIGLSEEFAIAEIFVDTTGEGGFPDENTMRANTLLIAAAPKLLDACKGDAIDEALRLVAESEFKHKSEVFRLLKHKQTIIQAAITLTMPPAQPADSEGSG